MVIAVPVADEFAAVIVQEPFCDARLSFAVAAIERKQDAVALENAADVGKRLLQFLVPEVVEHAVHHDDVCVGEFIGGGRIEIMTVKSSEMAEPAARVVDIGLIDVEADIVNARRQMAQNMTGTAANIDHAHAGTKRQIISDRLDPGTKESAGVLICLIERGMLEDRLHQEISSKTWLRFSGPEWASNVLSCDFSISFGASAGSCGSGPGKRPRR